MFHYSLVSLALGAGVAVSALGILTAHAQEAAASPATNAGAASVVCALDQLSAAPLEQRADGTRSFRFRGEPGLYQMSVFFDAADFDWPSLYVNLNDYHNEGQRTGPWDFEMKTVQPLVPSYWITLDGRKLGLWYAQRVSLEDVANKRFRGRFAFDVQKAGEHVLELAPFKAFKVTWISARLERDPDDQLELGLRASHPPSALPAAMMTDPAFWKQQQQKLETTNGLYRALFQAAMRAVQRGRGGSLPMLVAAYQLDGDTNALQSALGTVDGYIARPAWGRPQPDAYGYNGDIGGGDAIREMAWAYQMLRPQLGAEREARLLKKLALQGDIFMTQTLLNRDYWGGSLLQDHGRRAVADFGTAAMHLWGVIPEADRWVAYVVPRMRRALAAAPPEGYLPGSSYYSPSLYAQNTIWYRDALLARTGEDILEQPSLRHIPAYVASVLDADQRAMLVVENGDRIPLGSCPALFGALAARFKDGEAARLHKIIVESATAALARREYQSVDFGGLIWGMLAYDPSVVPAPDPPKSQRHVIWYQDAGFVQYRNDEQDVALALRCGPWLGYHAQLAATNPCDQMECRPGMGHFSLFLKGEPFLVSPDLGYKLSSNTSSIMLVDDHGQIGDAGYPMSIPSQPHSGAQVESVRWDQATGVGVIRLDLKRAYPPEAGVTSYTREFLVFPSHRIICRDRVVLNRPHRLSWLFQFHENSVGKMDQDLTARIGDNPALRIRPQPTGFAVTGKIAPTTVVYSYSSHFNKFDHVRYDSTVPVESAAIDFVMEW